MVEKSEEKMDGGVKSYKSLDEGTVFGFGFH